MEKKKVGIFSFSGCSGEQLMILDCEAQLLDIFSDLEIKTFPMAQSNNRYSELDIALLEGSITTQHQKEELQEIRKASKVLIAMGTCACFGGVQSMLLGKGGWKDRFMKVYENNEGLYREMAAFESQPCSAFVKVDHLIPGCPMDKDQFLHTLSHVLHNTKPHLYPFPVCTECKWKENDCLLNRGLPCLGPLTRGGCGAICPSHNLPCVGCWGPAETPNTTSEFKLLLEKGYSREEIIRKFRNFGGAVIADRLRKILDKIK
ncbi:NADH:ubiquinone oxidoreductase [bacterium]|nr:NADH:ubiquinone oxidoreductase [bacterium]